MICTPKKSDLIRREAEMFPKKSGKCEIFASKQWGKCEKLAVLGSGNVKFLAFFGSENVKVCIFAVSN